MSAVSLRSIVKGFGATPVLRDVSLEIEAGEFLSLLGPSGCGKSTLLRIIAGLEAADAGSVAIGGRSVDGLRPKLRDIAMVFQSYALYPHMTVAANLALPLRMRRLSRLQRAPLIGRWMPGAAAVRAAIDEDVRSVARALEIEALLPRKPRQLSGGQRQRVAVGRAMVRRPQVFLMDEPLSNLDAKLRVQMRAEIADLHRRLGVTFVYVTHDQAEAMTMSARIAVMIDGELLQVAPPQTIYADPADVRVAAFVGSPRINLLQGVVRDAGAVDAAGTLFDVATDLAPGTAVTVGLRPEALTLVRHAGRGVIAGRVRLVEHLGADLFVHLECAGEREPVIVRAVPDQHGGIVPGETLLASAAAGRLLLFGRDGRRLRERAAMPPMRSLG
jgi:multiple sugar transport system ATP-binding protein